MQTLDPQASLLSPIGYQDNGCGYCHRDSGASAYYASTSSIQPEFYQSLLNRGWRRSGTLLYKPDQRASCCPPYTIRLDSHTFRPTKDQRHTLNRFNKSILGDAYLKEAARLYPKSRDQAKKRDTDFDLLERIRESEKVELETPPEPAHALAVSLEADDFTEEKYALFENYQRIVHHEPPHRISKRGFKNFLCSSPLPSSKPTLDGRDRYLGSYHQCYRIDGKLIAMGVLDLLPQCVSAVYFMYHESVHQHGFGKLGALREIALAKEEGYRWWYAGFYIHGCVKMRYKADYTPQFMLDPESYKWDPLNDELKTKLDKQKFVSLSHEMSNEKFTLPRSIVGPADPIESNDIVAGDESSEDNALISNSDLPVLDRSTRSMPGILTENQLLTEIDLDHIKLRVQGRDAETCDLLDWESMSMDNPDSIKSIIVELVAAVGIEIGKKMVVSFG